MYSFYKGILLMYFICHCSGNFNCGLTHLTEPSGYLASPGFPNGLPQAGNCKWKIDPGPSEYVTVSFEMFRFPNNTSSWLSIGPAHGVRNIRFYTGVNPPIEPYISALGDGTIAISMLVNKEDISARFNLTYIRGPMSPSQNCPSHQFKCLNGKCILNSWWCNSQDECGDHSDEAHCHVLPTTPHSTSCPSHHFECISAMTNRLQCFEEIRKCDGHNDCENGDDEESCTTICQYSLVGTAGWFASPNFPEHYYDNLDCEWHISLGQDGIVQLRFLSFELESGFYMDYVKVTEEQMHPSTGEIQEVVIGQYYGSTEGIHSPPTVVESSGNSLTVKFHSDHSLNRRGFNATFQKKGFCIDNQKSCGENDDNCYDVEKERCDGHYTCHRGQDEVGCRNCSAGKIPCLLSGDCFLPEDRCNGEMSCRPNNEDEQLCPSEICGETEGLFLCGDQTCIQEKWVCDLQFDCTDGSDESDCEPTIKVVTAAVIGSLVCGMLLVAALSCTCKLYQLRNVRREGRSTSSHSPYYVYRGEHDQREAPPSYSATMASPHYAELQRAFVEGVQGISGSSRPSRGISRRRSRFLRLLSRQNTISSSATSNQELTHGGGTSEGRGGENPDQDGQSPQNEARMERISSEGTDPQNTIETSSLTTSDTDSEANQEVVQQAHLDQQILNAAANIHRIRVANRLLQRQHRSRRSDPAPESTNNLPAGDPVNRSSDSTNDSTTSSTSSSSATVSSTSQHHAGRGDQEEPAAESPSTVVDQGRDEEHSPAIIVGVSDPDDNRDDVQLLDDI